jgi:hypothetical protein
LSVTRFESLGNKREKKLKVSIYRENEYAAGDVIPTKFVSFPIPSKSGPLDSLLVRGEGDDEWRLPGKWQPRFKWENEAVLGGKQMGAAEEQGPANHSESFWRVQKTIEVERLELYGTTNLICHL